MLHDVLIQVCLVRKRLHIVYCYSYAVSIILFVFVCTSMCTKLLLKLLWEGKREFPSNE